MTKPTPPAPESEEIEMDAMDLEEWERDQRTPQAPDAKLTELVKQSAAILDEPKRPTQTLAHVLVKQQQTGLPPEPGSLDAQTVRAPPATVIHRETKPAAPNVVARTIASAPTRATPPAGISKRPVDEDSEGWALPDDVADSDWSSLATVPTPVAAGPKPAAPKPVAAKPVIAATTPARSDATPGPARIVATIPARRDATPGPARIDATTAPRGDATPGPARIDATTAARNATPGPARAVATIPARPGVVKPVVAAITPARSDATPPPRPATQAPPPPAPTPRPPVAAPPAGTATSGDDYSTETTTVGTADETVIEAKLPRRDATPSPAPTTKIGVPQGKTASPASGPRPEAVSVEALAAAVADDDVPELEPSQSDDDLAIPMVAPEPSVVIAREVSEPVRLPEPPQVPAPLPPPPRPRTQPVPLVVATQPQPMIPQPPVLPPTAQPAPKPPVAVVTQPRPSPAAPRDERWTQTDSLPIVRPRMSRAMIAIIGGAVAVAAIVVIVVATRGPSKETAEPAVIAKHDPEPTGSAEPVGRDTAGSADETGSGSATAPEPTGTPPTETEPTGTPPTGPTPTSRTPVGRTPTGRTPTIGKVPKTPPETPGTATTGPSSETLAAARASYSAGNSKLFAGDVEGAISAYKQTLALAPGYAAGYRGLGLAYAQQGNKAKSLQALRQYLAAAPNAKDAEIIRKRIAGLAGG